MRRERQHFLRDEGVRRDLLPFNKLFFAPSELDLGTACFRSCREEDRDRLEAEHRSKTRGFDFLRGLPGDEGTLVIA